MTTWSVGRGSRRPWMRSDHGLREQIDVERDACTRRITSRWRTWDGSRRNPPIASRPRAWQSRQSTAFVPTALMPGWLQTVNAWNPITYVIEAMRGLMVTGWDWPAISQ